VAPYARTNVWYEATRDYLYPRKGGSESANPRALNIMGLNTGRGFSVPFGDLAEYSDPKKGSGETEKTGEHKSTERPL
jgi:hypothetical protein